MVIQDKLYSKKMDKDKFNYRSYRLLFSHLRMVEDLIKSFIKEDFVDKIEYNTLTPVKISFIFSKFKRRGNFFKGVTYKIMNKIYNRGNNNGISQYS